jgi:hypothetical protein
MIGEPYGYMENLGNEWNKFHTASENCVVVQVQSMSGIASMRIRDGVWEIELGQ